VVSASRGSDRLGDVAAPVFVITRDDILRTGVRSLPEALRLAPGVDVARLSGARWRWRARRCRALSTSCRCWSTAVASTRRCFPV